MFNHRLIALFLKELRQIRGDRRLMISLVLPPVLQITLFGFALNSTVSHLRMGIVDESRTADSRMLIDAVTQNQTFEVKGYFLDPATMGRQIDKRALDLGMIIPADYARLRESRRNADVQFVIDAVNANTAQIAQGYIAGAMQWFNGQALPAATVSKVSTNITLLYNPGLDNAWFIVTGIFGLLLVLNGSIVASATMIREKVVGTVEQLLMTPADALEIILAKMAPLFLLLMGTATLVFCVARVVFHVPMHGSFALLMFSAALCVLAGIGIGTMIATFATSATQAQLMSLFVNPPLSILSGATTPVEAMPRLMQPWTDLDPIKHFAIIARSVMVKGTGIDVLYPHLLALAAMAFVLIVVSGLRFRRQLG